MAILVEIFNSGWWFFIGFAIAITATLVLLIFLCFAAPRIIKLLRDGFAILRDKD